MKDEEAWNAVLPWNQVGLITDKANIADLQRRAKGIMHRNVVPLLTYPLLCLRVTSVNGLEAIFFDYTGEQSNEANCLSLL